MLRVSTLERSYPEIPGSVLLKADLAFSGLQVNQALVAAGKNASPHFRPVEFQGQRHPIPYFLHLPDADHPGHELLALVRAEPTSPYHLEKRGDGGFDLWERDARIAPVRPHPKPEWYIWAEKEGLRRAMVSFDPHGDMLVVNLTPACDYWQAPGETTSFRCLFCGYGAVSARSECLGQQRGVTSPDHETLREFERVLPLARKHLRHLYLVGGSMRDRDAEGERYVQITSAAVRADASFRGIIGCGSQALPKQWMKRIHEAGAGYCCFNLEIWDPVLWEKLCPGKAAFIGRDRWLQDMMDAVDIFGRGAVFSAFVAGAELVPPLGFRSSEEALASAVEGTDWMLSRGMVPIYSPFSPIANSAYGGTTGPTLDYFLRLNLETAKLRKKHRLLVDTRFICSDCTYAQIECDLDQAMR